MIFPILGNLAGDQITVKYLKEATIEIVNASGQIVKTITNNGTITSIDLSELAKGVYMLNVKPGAGTIV